MPSVLLYADVNMNIVDGSSVWLASMAEAVAGTGRQVSVLLKTPVTNDRLVLPLLGNPRIRLIDPDKEIVRNAHHTPETAAIQLEKLLGTQRVQHVIVRGFRACVAASQRPLIARRLWSYITDVPFPLNRLTDVDLKSLDTVAKQSKRMFAQTEDARSYLEAIAPSSTGKTILLPPMIPDAFFVEAPVVPSPPRPRKIVYAGKFAKHWRTLEMCSLPSILESTGSICELTMVGDKFQDDLADPEWPLRMQDSIKNLDVNWLGGVPREHVGELLSRSDMGLSWRAPEMNSSLEISTKILEYAAASVAPVLNRTKVHERLLGADYPLFIESDSLNEVARVVTIPSEALTRAKARARSIALDYSISAAVRRLNADFRAVEPFPIFVRERPARVVLASHDFKFVGELIDTLQNDKSIDLRIDRWQTLHAHDESASQELLEWADIIICEWAGPNAVWYSRNKSAHQRLFVRLHGFEIRGAWLANLKMDAVESVICVSEYYRQLVCRSMNWSESDITIIPNAVNCSDLDRPKSLGAQFHLGMVGIVPFIKRPDRAVETLRLLRTYDDRFTLHIKGRMPWEYPWEWKKPHQREAYEEFFSSIRSNRLERNISFEPFSSDIGSWLRKIGFVLSPSVAESFHLAPVEGMASGAVPVVWERPGAEEVFGKRFLVADPESASQFIREYVESDNNRIKESVNAKEQAAMYDVARVMGMWRALLGS